jgi:AraC family transcriptional regulator
VKSETVTFYEAAVTRTVERITASLDEALDLGALAREAALSPFHFHRIFRGMLGETPLEMHRRLRLERAASELLVAGASVTTVAFAAGYETHEAFTRAFRHAYGRPPSAFRPSTTKDAECTRPLQTQLAARSGIHYVRGPASDPPSIRFSKEGALMNVTVEDMPGLRVAAVRHVGPYNQIAEAFQRLGDIAGPAGLLKHQGMMLAVYHDDPETTPAAELASDAGVTVPEGVPLPEGVVEKRLPAGRYARTTHIGPYTTLGDTWSCFMGEWLPKSGMRVGSGASYEVYRNTPMDTKPEELRTDLYLPLA